MHYSLFNQTFLGIYVHYASQSSIYNLKIKINKTVTNLTHCVVLSVQRAIIHQAQHICLNVIQKM